MKEKRIYNIAEHTHSRTGTLTDFPFSTAASWSMTTSCMNKQHFEISAKV